MFGRRLTLFRIFGFAVRVDASWIVIAVLVTWSLAGAVFPAELPGMPVSTYWWMGAVGAVGLFGSIVFHELCHSLVANHYKLPMRGITLFIFGGVAEMSMEPQNPKVEFLMAIAGPASSVVLGFLFYGLARAWGSGWAPEAALIVSYLAWINWVLAAFNMIPAFPLDGGRVLRSILWHFKGNLMRATRIATLVGTGFAYLLMAFGLYELLTGFFITAVWYFLIGMFLRGASQMSYRQLTLREALEGEPVQRFMRLDPVTVSPDTSIRQLVEDFIYRYHFKSFPVVTGTNDLAGCVTARDVGQVPREEWDLHRVAEVLEPCSDVNTVTPDTDAFKAFSKMRETGASRLLVADRHRLVGMISIRDVIDFLATKMDLERRSGRFAHL
jgi:Zn-dependent protease/predicted transcriptional regulator